MFDMGTEQQLFLRWANGDESAAAFLEQMGAAGQIIDDLADGDVTSEAMMETLGKLVNVTMLHLPTNTFLQKHHAELVPVMLAAFLNWQLSAKWEKAPETEKKVFAYVLRESLDQVIGVVAYITGGMMHAMTVTAEVAEFYHAKHAEPIAAFLKEHK